jgi:hypothetical protein
MGESRIAFCPNCQQPAKMIGNEILCEKCDAVFEVTEKQGAKVRKIGTLEDHESRLAALEGKTTRPQETDNGEDDEQKENNEEKTNEQDEEILPR